jgi:hypothetical protein
MTTRATTASHAAGRRAPARRGRPRGTCCRLSRDVRAWSAQSGPGQQACAGQTDCGLRAVGLRTGLRPPPGPAAARSGQPGPWPARLPRLDSHGQSRRAKTGRPGPYVPGRPACSTASQGRNPRGCSLLGVQVVPEPPPTPLFHVHPVSTQAMSTRWPTQARLTPRPPRARLFSRNDPDPRQSSTNPRPTRAKGPFARKVRSARPRPDRPVSRPISVQPTLPDTAERKREPPSTPTRTGSRAAYRRAAVPPASRWWSWARSRGPRPCSRRVTRPSRGSSRSPGGFR